jgi:hypothetical protein
VGTHLIYTLYRSSRFLIRKVLFERAASDEPDGRVGVVLNVFELDPGITLPRRRATCCARCSAASDDCEWCGALHWGSKSLRRMDPNTSSLRTQ